MVHGNVKKLAFLAAAFGVFTASQAFAADVTDVLDAADEVYLGDQKVSDPFDISLTPKFSQKYESAKLKREFFENNTMHNLNELQYKRVVNKMDIDLEIGLFHDLSFRMGLPIIISDQSKYKFDSIDVVDPITGEKTGEKTTVGNNSYFNGTASADNHGDDAYKYFALEDNTWLKGKSRSGIGDMTFGIAWSPYNTERHFIPERPWENNTGRSTVTLAFDYKAPTGKAKEIDNSAVGSGAHELIFSVAASHRFAFVDPYIRLQYGLPIATDDAYPDFGSNQKRRDPGMWGRVDLGIEFIPYESIDVKFQRNVKIDLRGYFKYTAEGRAYSELGDAFATGDCYSAESMASMGKNCKWVADKWSNAGTGNIEAMANGTYDGPLKEDGYFDYEGFATIGGAINLTIMPIQYVAIIAGFAMDYTQNHFITFTKVGKDRSSYDDKGVLKPGGEGVKDGLVTESVYEERNPTFSTALDAVGHRIKRTESMNMEWFVGLRLMY